MSQKYDSPAAFKQALEHRLRAGTAPGIPLARTRQLAVFDRVLARIVHVFGDAVTLKGGVALELRLERARTTKDIDLRMMGPPVDLLERLQEAGRLDLDDFMSFDIEPDPRRPDIDAEGMKYDGFRFKVECNLAGKLYGQRFGVDVAFGDPIIDAPEIVVADDVLGFAGIPPTTIGIYPIETHIAEKLHAYTLPRSRPNSRVKDLPDIALLGTIRSVESTRLRAAIAQTFAFRATHDAPTALPEPPPEWFDRYAALAVEDQLPWPTLAATHLAAKGFLDTVLVGSGDARWEPASWRWHVRA